MMQNLRSTLVLLALLLASGAASAISTAFTYQGYLEDAGQPADGSYDLQFTLQTQAGDNVPTPPVLRDDVAVSGGVFSVDLDFGITMDGDAQLKIGVRPGASSGAFTTLVPPTLILPTPQAGVAASVSPNSIKSASIANGTIVSVDIGDGSVASADIADGVIAAVDINSSQVQRRVATGCASNAAIRSINADGTVVCVQGPLGPAGPVERDFGALYLEDYDVGDTRNFAVAAGRLALVNGYSIDLSSDLSFSHGTGDTIIVVLTAGYYEFSYDLTFRATDAAPDIELGVFFVRSPDCVPQELTEATGGGIGAMDLSMVLDNQLNYPVSGSVIEFFTANSCVALMAYEWAPGEAGNEAEMIQASITARRIQ